jgi:N-acetylglucosaminyl-diphospho-decaprenol L-rhamnosyltransferase
LAVFASPGAIGAEQRIALATVDVVLVCYNSAHTIGTALDSVFALTEVRTDPSWANVVVADNGSTDGSLELMRSRYGDRVKIVENGANIGFGAACNRALAVTSAPFAFLLNPDAQLKDGALAAAVAFLEEHPRCGLAGSRTDNADGSIQQTAGEFDTWAGAFLRSSAWGDLPLLRRFANGASLRDFGYDEARRVDLAIGAALAVRRAMFDELGGFDERYFLYHEEVDLAKRAAGAGWETWFVPGSGAIHLGMASSSTPARVEKHKQRSRRQYWIKHHGYAWYAALVAALIGRYVLYACALFGVVAFGRWAVSRR